MNSLPTLMEVSSFGIAAAHVSGARFELGQMACLRLSLEGTRIVGVLSFEAVQAYLKNSKNLKVDPTIPDMQQWAMNMSQAELMAFAGRFPRGLGLATVGPGDMLYTRPGAIVHHRALHGSDVIGMRLGVLSKELAKIHTMLMHATAVSESQSGSLHAEVLHVMGIKPAANNPATGMLPAAAPAAQDQKEAATNMKAAEAPQADDSKKHGAPENQDQEEKANDCNGSKADRTRTRSRRARARSKAEGATVPQPPGAIAAGGSGAD